VTGTSDTHRSAIRADDWLPVHQALLAGLVHACNNRVAALSGISQLYEAKLSSGDEGMQQLLGEVEKLRALMGLFRLALNGRSARREPARMGEALQTAATLLGHHLDARHARFEAPAESGEVEPVLLWPGDAVRIAVLAFLAASADAGKGVVEASIARVGDETVVAITAPGTESGVMGRSEFAALVYALDREGGTVSCASMSGATILLTLALPGMTKATARGAH
jgi:hypothetical protein